jgi:hypothetical protein
LLASGISGASQRQMKSASGGLRPMRLCGEIK